MGVILEKPYSKKIVSFQAKREFKRHDIWMAEMREGRGSEQTGMRPVLIISNDIGNAVSPVVIAAPLTSSLSKSRLPTHVHVKGNINGLERDSIVLLEQPLTLDKSRLKHKICSLDDETMKRVNNALGIAVGLAY